MIAWLGKLQDWFAEPPLWAETEALRRAQTLVLALVFILCSTFILAMESLVPSGGALADLEIGDVVTEDIRAPRSLTYVSAALTERARDAAAANVVPIYDPPDPNIARQQLSLTRQILDYMGSVRLDAFGTREQKLNDLNAIIALTLSPDVAADILDADDTLWRAIDAEAMLVLERVMREPIREPELAGVEQQLPVQVSVRLDSRAAAVVVAILEDMIRPNQFPNPIATETARQEAASAVQPESRSFAQGQVVVRGGTRLDAIDYEALAELGLLQTANTIWLVLARSLLASVIVMVSIGLYIVRFQPDLREQLPFVTLLVALFLIGLLGAQVFVTDGQFYLYPAAALALLYVSLGRVELAIVAGLGLAMLFGLLTNGSLEATFMAAFGSLIGAASLRRTERVNTYFVAGLMIAAVNLIVLTIFNLDSIAAGDQLRLGALIGFSLINGLFAAATALAGMYLVTLLFNLPTSLKLVELSQTNQPLLQRLLREAPGTYQHSLQVANLSEQAATEIGANAQLVRVSALYHDIGKMFNPAFFIENQAENVNPHEQLNDPYRSTDIIISHVIDGERLARQSRLPARVIDFITEHHGTTLVSYFYRKAVDSAADADSVDEDQFRYPGPRPRTRETAIMMLADTCESTVRARKPTTRQQVSEIVTEMIDLRLRDGQLDDSDLTSRDIKQIREIFIEMLQAVYHPRINYPTLPTPRKDKSDSRDLRTSALAAAADAKETPAPTPEANGTPPRANGTAERRTTAANPYYEAPDDAPLPEVPPLRRVSRGANGGEPATDSEPRSDTPTEQPKP
jgi:hypothetical protein